MIAFTSSIRRQLLCWLLIPVTALLAIDTGLANFVALEIANDAYDDSLIDSAEAIAGHLKFDDGGIVDLSNTALAFLKSSQADSIFYQVLDSSHRYAGGEKSIPPPGPELEAGEPDVRSGSVRDRRVRIASVIVTPPSADASGDDYYIIQVAETMQSRNGLITKIVLSILLPQLILILFTGLTIWYGVKKGLLPLSKLADAVARRSPTDLKPLSEVSTPKEVKPLVASINKLLDRVREDRNAQKRFVANAAHQLRTPIAGLKTQSQLALRQKDPRQLHREMEQISSSAERAGRLVHQLLTLARVEPSRFICLEPVDLEDIARQASRALVPLALEKSIDLGFERTAWQPMVAGDSESLHELMVNLIENAVIYTPVGGTVTVRIEESSSSPDRLEFIVEDNGPGVPPEERERVFERFYRALGTGVTGSGLGLAIVREIADSHSASVEVGAVSNGTGTIVRVSFLRVTVNATTKEPSEKEVALV